MSAVASQLTAVITINGADKAKSDLASIGSEVDSAGSKLGVLAAGAVAAAGVAIVGLGVVSTKMAGDFQQSMTKLTTTANESTDKIKMVGSGILDMSAQVGTGAQKLGDAMYWIESGGAHAQTALDYLKIAAMGAKSENANLDDTAKALMFTLNNFGSTGLSAAGAMNTLIAGVGGGEMSMNDLSGAISNVMPTAKIFGISLTDIVAGLDTMTMQGDNASAAATHLAMMIKQLEAPSTAGAKAIASIGLTTQQVTDEMRVSLPDAIEMITSAMKKKFPEGSTAYNEALKAISGGSRSMAAIMETSGTQMDTFRLNVDNINKAVKAGGNSIAGWADVQQNFNFKIDQAKAAIESFQIKIGTALLPIVTRVIGYFSDNAMPILNNLSDWFITKGIPAIQQFADFITSNFLPSFIKIGAALNTIDIFEWISGELGLAMPLLSQIGKGFSDLFANIAKYMSSTSFTNFITDIFNLGSAIIRLDLSRLKEMGPIVQIALGTIGTLLTSVVIPAIDLFVMALHNIIELMNSGSIAGNLLKGALIGISVAFTLLKISDFIETIPFLVAGFLDWGAAAWVAASGTIALTLPFLAIGALVGIVVAGIILAIQHWGDIMGWITGKAEQTRISVEQSHVKMRISQDENTAKGAQAAINNFEIERQGIIQKLKETNDEAEKQDLMHQLTMVTSQESASQKKLQVAEDDKKKQLAKQKELHDQMEEAQKPWIVRMGDGIKYGFDAAWQWISDRAVDAWHWIQGVFAPVGQWFGDRWHDIQVWWGNAGKWFQDVGSTMWKGITDFFGGIGKWFGDRWHDVQNLWGGAGKWFEDIGASMWKGITSFFGTIGKWFSDRWNEITTPLKPITDYIGQVFQTLWNIIVALWGKLGAKFHEWFTEAYNATTSVFGNIGQWFHDRWNDITKVFSNIGGWFHDAFMLAVGAIYLAFGTIGKWFQDRWQDIAKVFAPIGGWFHDRWTEAYNSTTAAFTPIGAWFHDRWNEIAKIFQNVGDWFHDRWTEAWNATTVVFSVIGKWFGDRWQEIVRTFQNVGGWFHDRFTEAWNKIVEVFTPISKWFSDRWNDITNGLNTFKNNAVAKFNELGTDVQNIFHNIINGIIDKLNGGVHAVVDFLNYFGKGLNDLAKSLGTTGTVQILTYSPIPHYAQGTDAHPGGLMVVGEEGPELLSAPAGTKVASHKDTKDILAAMAGGKIPGYAAGIGDIASNIMSWVAGGAKSVLDGLINTMNIKAPDLPGMENIASGMFNKVKDWALSWIDKILPKFMATAGGTAGTPVNVPGTVADWIKQAMALTSTPANWLNDLETIVMHESGGNPAAINLTDSNAQAGHPSQGLFQTIPSTFAAYALPGYGNIISPIDNSIAGIRYIKSRYGDVFHVPGIESLASGGSYVGYAEGTNYAPGGMAVVGERGPELMYVPRGAQIFPNSQLTSGSQSGSSSNPTIVHIHNYIDGKEMTDVIGSRLVKSARSTGPIRSNA